VTGLRLDSGILVLEHGGHECLMTAGGCYSTVDLWYSTRAMPIMMPVVQLIAGINCPKIFQARVKGHGVASGVNSNDRVCFIVLPGWLRWSPFAQYWYCKSAIKNCASQCTAPRASGRHHVLRCKVSPTIHQFFQLFWRPPPPLHKLTARMTSDWNVRYASC
jgi:hypothetical protein